MEERQADIHNTSIEYTDDDEIKLCEISKHPMGILSLYAMSSVGVIFGLGLAFFLLPSVIEDTATAFSIASIFTVIVGVLAICVTFIATLIYRQNRLIITDRNITQMLQYGLFSRKVSQLNLVNVEDVTSLQQGFASTFFGYGVLIIETAGEQSNFKFTFCPRPGYYAKVILNAREKILGQQDGYATTKHPSDSKRSRYQQ